MTRGALVRIVYLSHAVPGLDPDAIIGDILDVSRRNNARAGVTGALIYNRGSFGQVLEGPEAAVEDTFGRIEADPRHAEIQVLDLKTIDARAFGDWSMGFVGRPSSMPSGEAEARRTTLDLATMGGDEMFATLHRIALGRDLALRLS